MKKSFGNIKTALLCIGSTRFSKKQVFHAFYHDIANERILYSIYFHILPSPREHFREFADGVEIGHRSIRWLLAEHLSGIESITLSTDNLKEKFKYRN